MPPDAMVPGGRLMIRARLENGRADPNTVHVILDGRDVTADASISDHDVNFTAQNLPPGRHDVRVSGRDTNGARFERSWSFSVRGQ